MIRANVAPIHRWLAAAISLLAVPAGAQSGAPTALGAILKRADSAWEQGDVAQARGLYAAVLSRDSTQSRAIFRLAQLDASESHALALYRRYIALEPGDAWGHMAEGDLLARMGRWAEALIAYESARAVSPGERDIAIGISRVLERAGRAPDGVEELVAWTVTHPDDGEAWDFLGRMRMRADRPRAAIPAFQRAARLGVRGASNRLHAALAAAGPSVSPDAASMGDSDGNRTHRLGGAVDFMVADGVRLGVGAQRHVISDDLDEVRGSHAFVRAGAGPMPGVTVTAQGGLARFDASPRGAGWSMVQSGLRLRARTSGNGPSADLRIERAPVGFSPQLVANRVSRSETRLVVELPVAAVRLRGSGRVAQFEAPGEPRNGRTGVEGAVVLPLGGGRVQPALQYRLVGFDRASAAGYFAPRRAETAEGGLYFDLGDDGPLSIAADIGAGVQRVAEHHADGPPSSAAVGPWSRILRAWGQASLALGPSRSWVVELEAYDAPFALEGATAGSWRFISISSGLRRALR